jgi:phospholipase D-like protein
MAAVGMLIWLWLLAIWSGGAVLTAVDAGRRYAHASSRRLWTILAIVLPVVGPGLYLAARPETREERRLRHRRLMYLEVMAGQPSTNARSASATSSGASSAMWWPLSIVRPPRKSSAHGFQTASGSP